jgi:hypothetical protein
MEIEKMEPKNCAKCKHSMDLVAAGAGVSDSFGRTVCKAPQLRDYLTISYVMPGKPDTPGPRHQNSMTNANTVRDVASLCGHAALWHDPI